MERVYTYIVFLLFLLSSILFISPISGDGSCRTVDESTSLKNQCVLTSDQDEAGAELPCHILDNNRLYALNESTCPQIQQRIVVPVIKHTSDLFASFCLNEIHTFSPLIENFFTSGRVLLLKARVLRI